MTDATADRKDRTTYRHRTQHPHIQRPISYNPML